MPAITGAGRVKTRRKSSMDSATPIDSMMIVSSVVTCGAMPVTDDGERYAKTEASTAHSGKRRVTRASMKSGPGMLFCVTAFYRAAREWLRLQRSGAPLKRRTLSDLAVLDAALAHLVKTQRHQQRDARESGGESPPQAARAEPEMKRERVARRKADAPVAERSREHRNARVFQSAQATRADRLHSVDDLEQCRHAEQRARERDGVRVGGIVEMQIQPDDELRRGNQEYARQAHERS